MRRIPSKPSCLQAIKEHGSQRAAAAALGTTKDILHKVVKDGYSQQVTAWLEIGDVLSLPTGGYQPVSDSHEMELQVEDIRSFDDLFKFFAIDSDEWEVADGSVLNVWDGKPQLKARLKRKVAGAATIDDLLEEIRASAGQHWVQPRVYGNDDDAVTVFALSDIHLGKLAEEEMTGAEQTLELSREWVKTTLARLVSWSKGGCHAVLPIGNDFLQVDNILGTTSSGTRVESNASIYRSFSFGRQLLQEMVNTLLTSFEKVTVVPVRGNHDSFATHALAETLAAIFSGSDRVDVRTSAKHRQYVRHGDVLLGFTHGKKDRPDKLASLMATEGDRLGLYSGSKVRWWFLGHLHKYEATEVNGTVIRRVRSLCADDLWHDEELFSGNGKAGEVFRFGSDGSWMESFMAKVEM